MRPAHSSVSTATVLEARTTTSMTDTGWSPCRVGLCRPRCASTSIGLGGLADYFERLADDWRGWKGERRWASLEDDLELAASHDGLGTVTLTARLRTEAFAHHRWSASTELVLDAGGLDRISRAARVLP